MTRIFAVSGICNGNLCIWNGFSIHKEAELQRNILYRSVMFYCQEQVGLMIAYEYWWEFSSNKLSENGEWDSTSSNSSVSFVGSKICEDQTPDFLARLYCSHETRDNIWSFERIPYPKFDLNNVSIIFNNLVTVNNQHSGNYVQL